METKRTTKDAVLAERADVLIAISAATAANCIPCFEHLYKKAVTSGIPAIEIKRIMKLMGIPKEAGIKKLDELVEIIETSFQVVRTSFMKFDFGFPEKNRLHGQFESCFAHDGVKRFGMIETYDCGILERVKGWLEAMEVDYNMTPEYTGCLMHQKGFCEVDFYFALD